MKYYQLKRLVGEISPVLVKSRIEKVYHPEENCIQLDCYTTGQKFYFTIRTSSGLASCYLTDARAGDKGHPASDFCMKLRSRIEGTILDDIRLEENDRIICLSFKRKGQIKEILVAELFTVGANCYLLDENDRVLAVLNPVAAKARSNFPGSQFSRAKPVEKIQQQDEETDPLSLLMTEKQLKDYNSAVRTYYESSAADKKILEKKAFIKKALSRELKRLKRLCQSHQQTVSQADTVESYRESAELLSANFRSLKKGLNIIRLPDIFRQGRPVNRAITLDPALSPQDNIQRYYKKYKKLKSGIKYARAHLIEVRQGIENLNILIEKTERATGENELNEFAELAGIKTDTAGEKTKGAKAHTRLPYRKFRASDGSMIMVGRGPRDNDELTFRIARGNDLWLHASAAGGAHVVLSCARDGLYSEEALLDAAHLAAFYSNLKGNQRVDVDYTSKKNVSRPKNAPPGKAVISGRKTIHLRLDRKRLERLLNREKQDFSKIAEVELSDDEQ